ncbi:hypothetical protein GCM10011380_00350 [Sphingomonas metalli]|uniref:Uncharacterized protein n=1 Tax=Sphingomonas metalli TaxID=1779358 RepID=A0A916SUQ4_9SPHN|nr:hypothetical protein [Sphingomonas metalli]GGB14874.1 hypothetical protein GCM10011380_00350 [Sphingomonas metalli]
MSEEHDALHRLRNSIRAEVLWIESIAAALIRKGLLTPSEITLPMSIAELQVLDPELRELWSLARNRLAEGSTPED